MKKGNFNKFISLPKIDRFKKRKTKNYIMDTELIQLKEVTKKFGKNVILDSVNLSIPENKITGIIGASGEGKTTILKLLIGFYKPTSGEVLYLRKNVFKAMRDIEKCFGFATEDGSFYNKLTVRENLFYFARLYGVKTAKIQDAVEDIINLVELPDAINTLAEDLSIGMKKRLDLACSLVHDPKILIMDEPTEDLDPLLRQQMIELIKKIKKQGTTIILTTHLLNEMDHICDKIAILFNKQIVEDGPPAKIKKKYGQTTLDGVFKKIFSQRVKARYQEKRRKGKERQEPEEKGPFPSIKELKEVLGRR